MGRSSLSVVLTGDNSTMVNVEEDIDNIGLISLDPGLEPYKDHFKYRMKRYLDQKKLIETHEGSLEEFALGNDEIKVSFFFFTNKLLDM